MLVEGVPGTGKTATVHQVIKYLEWKSKKEALPAFQFCEINGIKLSDAKMTYVHLAKVGAFGTFFLVHFLFVVCLARCVGFFPGYFE